MQMATAEISTAACEGDHEGRALCPSEEDAPSVLNETSAPLNFSELTPSQFGISVQSFTPAASVSSKRKGERTDLYLTAAAVAFTLVESEERCTIIAKNKVYVSCMWNHSCVILSHYR